MLLWALTAACLAAERPELAAEAVERAGPRLARDGWPEHYDGPPGRLVGRGARLVQVWTAASLLVARALLRDPAPMGWLRFPDPAPVSACEPGAEGG